MNTPLPPIDYLRSLFTYDPITGYLTRDGKRAGFINGRKKRYRRVGINGRQYLEHRIIWAIWHGHDPGDAEIDHRDKDTLNNRIDNLRSATCAQNRMNGNNRGGAYLRGVRPEDTGRFRAQIGYDGKKLHLGTFDTEEEAHNAYKQASLDLHGEFGWQP